MSEPAFEVLHGSGPIVLTCEHASRRVPERLPVSASDRAWLATHWGWDIGAGDVTRALVSRLSANAVLGCWSRLVCDLNRPLDDATWMLTEIEGSTLSFNEGVSDAERQRRTDEVYAPYHASIDDVVGRVRRDHGAAHVLLLAIHSFTPSFAGQMRDMEIGVLFDERHDTQARRLAEMLEEDGFAAACNEPYSGYDGLISAVQRHGRQHEVPYMELEIRQDLIGDSAGSARVSRRLGAIIEEFWLSRA